ncbi:hypothetical protein EIB71_08870 [Kaistella daneshvariae]|uniref:IS66 family transposase n=1 Tax=Kaistella daneshvariae TaxID=2487074 RepID=A0ABN5SZF9_9FLAO|nr:hypothetical protein [Kaistella daneshvariae]AZI67768.1 hypothetical protein EIB71_08870 [Kaistella daneshvariae]
MELLDIKEQKGLEIRSVKRLCERLEEILLRIFATLSDKQKSADFETPENTEKKTKKTSVKQGIF